MPTPLSIAQTGLVLAQSVVSRGPYPSMSGYPISNGADADVPGIAL